MSSLTDDSDTRPREYALCQRSVWWCPSFSSRVIKLKFRYADFATKSAKFCRRHKSWKYTTQIMSPTFPVTNGFVPDLSRTLLQTSRHVEIVCVHDFCDSCLRISPRGSFGESWRSGIGALTKNFLAKSVTIYSLLADFYRCSTSLITLLTLPFVANN